MNITELILYFFVGITIVSALFLAWTKNIVHAAFSFLFVLLGIAALFVFAGAEFVAITQIMIYVGGVLVLIIFGVMLTPKYTELIKNTKRSTSIFGILIGFLIVIGLIYSFTFLNFENIEIQNERIMKMTNPQTIGFELLTTYILPFEISSILLLVALIGAATIASYKLPTKIDK